MICDQYKTIFIHIPRNAGTSVKNVLQDTSGSDKHLTVDEIRLKEPVKAYKYHKWTIVRNPWERELSLYQYAIKNNLIKSMTFKEYLKKIIFEEIDNPVIRRNQIEYFTYGAYVEIDQIVRLEYIDATWSNLCKKLSIEESILEHKNKSSISDQVYDKECVNLVNHIRKADIEFLNYDCPY